MTDSTTKLRSLLQALPQELYDKIYNITFTTNPGVRRMSYKSVQSGHGSFDRVDTSKRFEAPDSVSLFLVDRDSSQQFAVSYFGGQGVVFKFEEFTPLRLWAKGLNSKHRNLVQDHVEWQGIRLPKGWLDLAHGVHRVDWGDLE